MTFRYLALFAAGLLPAQSQFQPQTQIQQRVHGKLLNPIASYSPSGQRFAIRLGAPAAFGEMPILPEGTILQGTVREARRVGLGIRRERAQMRLDFEKCTPPGFPSAPCLVELLDIENAREQVAKGNRIHGVLAASNPNSLFQGIWFRPAGAFLRRSPAGLTGPVGALQHRIAPSPIGAAITVSSRLVLFSLPNTDIELPAGTELILRIKASTIVGDPVLPLSAVPPPAVPLNDSQIAYLENLPTEIRNASGKLVGDRLNLLFRGSRSEIETAFGTAGWTTADPLTRKSFAKSYAAFTSLRCYAQAPVSPLFYQRSTPDFVFQKSFNTMAKRHHIRFWRIAPDSQDPDAPQLWAAAATHDIGIAFDWNRFSLTHRIDDFLDTERSKVLNDLASSKCVRQLTMLDRPALAGKATDGKLAVLELNPCSVPSGESPAPVLPKPSNPMPARVTRRLVLETRYYITRANAYYWAYRAVKKTTDSLRRLPQQAPAVVDLPDAALASTTPAPPDAASGIPIKALR